MARLETIQVKIKGKHGMFTINKASFDENLHMLFSEPEPEPPEPEWVESDADSD